MTNGALGRRDLFDGRLTNSGTKLIFRIIEGLSWPTRENSGTNLMVHSKNKGDEQIYFFMLRDFTKI